MLPPPDHTRFKDMRDFARDAMDFIAGIDEARFLADRQVQYACIRCIEVIGEAASKVTTDTRLAFPELPWPYMAPMRNLCIHDYGRVDPSRIWQTITTSLPELVTRLDRILAAHPSP